MNRQAIHIYKGWIGILLVVLAVMPSFGQTESDTTQGEPIIVINADKTKGFDKGERSILTGDVILRQDSTVIYAHQVNLNSKANTAVAAGSVIIQRSDTTNAYCNQLVYSGNRQYAKMEEDVVLENGAQKLFSEQLEYDLGNNIAYYESKALMTDGERVISSKRGKYYIDSSLVVFYDSVVVAGPDITIVTDSLHFNTQTREAIFVAPTRMKQGENDIYCEEGYYKLQENMGELRKNAQFSSPKQQATADTIIFYGKTEDFILIGNTWVKENDRQVRADRIEYKNSEDKAILIGNVDYVDADQKAVGDRMEYTLSTGAFKTDGPAEIVQGAQRLKADQIREIVGQDVVRATGNVVWVDTVQQVSLYCADAFINQETTEVKAFGDDLLFITQMEGDSLYVTADTLFSTEIADSLGETARQLQAYHHVVGYKTDLQFIADSMAYNEFEDVFRLFGKPIIWSDTSQFYGDTIAVKLIDQEIHSMTMTSNAFVINKTYDELYNQVSGRRIIAYFADRQLTSTHVKGNAQSVYYATDDGGAFVGVNDIECGEMKLNFKENKVATIRFYQKPTSEFHPMAAVSHEALRLKGFSLAMEMRPQSRLDIYRIQSMLKEDGTAVEKKQASDEE